MRLLLITALVFVPAMWAGSNAPTPVDPPVISDAPKAKKDVSSTQTPTAEAPFFGTRAWIKRAFVSPAVPRIELQRPVRIADYAAGGKLELSLRTYLELVLANNTDIAVERLTIEPSRNNILRQYSVFDPTILASFNANRTETPATQRIDVAGGGTSTAPFVVSNLNQPLRFNYTQLLPTGTQYNVSFNTIRASSNSRNFLFNPQLSSGFNVNLAQPLLRNRGGYVTKLPITIARSRLLADEAALESRIMQLLATAENAYWDVISARENLQVQEQALALADASLKRAQKELELGAISSLEIYQPQQQYASFEIGVTQARFRLQQAEDALRRQISADLDPAVRDLPIVLTESITPPANTALDREQLVQSALRLRPDLKQRRQALDVDDLTIKSTSNLLKPDFALTAQYGSNGQNLYNTSTGYLQGTLGDALGQAFGFTYPAYGFGLRLSFPLRDRRASADYADAIVNKRLDLLRLRSAEQAARQEVLNAVSSVESAKASVELAKVALDFAQKRVEADQKRYDLGTITLFFLLDSQNALTRAQSDLVNQSVQYRRSLVNLYRVTGELLTERGVAVQ